MAPGEGARNRYQATIDDQQDRTVNPHVVAVNTPLYILAFACENNASQALDRTVDYLLTQELYASDDVTVVIAQLKVDELAHMVDNYALLLAVDADGREVARLTPDPMRSSRIGAPPIPILDEASRIVWSG